MARRNSAYGVHSMAKGLAQAPHWPRSRNGTSGRTTPWRRGWALASCKPPPSLAREGRAADSPAGRFDGLRRTRPLCAVSSSSPGLRIQGPGLQIHADTACRVPLQLGHYLPYTTPPLPYFPPRAPTSTSPVSDCTVPCHVMVHPEYAYSSALLWADLP